MSDKDEKVLYEEKIGNVFDEIKKLSDNNLIELYLYPNKPNTINKVDLDYIDRISKIEKIYNKKTERKELLKLNGDKGGKKILLENRDDLFVFEVLDKKELIDIDFKSQLEDK